MTPQINSLMDEIRRRLEKTEMTAWGPEPTGVPADDSHLAGQPGEGGADNITDVQDSLDLFLSDIADHLQALYELDDEGAYEFIFSVANDLAKEGSLPPVPGDEAPEEEISQWIGAAGSIMFAARVMCAAREQAAE